MTFATILSDQLGYFTIGAIYSLGLTFASMFFGLSIGLLFGLGRMSKSRIIRSLATGYVNAMRGMPFLVLLIWFYYGMPVVIDYSFSPLFAGITCLSCKYSGFLAEIFRSGLQAIEKGQVEAAFSLGLSKFQAWRRIVIPQAVRLMIPPIGNAFVSMVQDSSVVMIVGIWELMRRGNQIANITMKPFEVYTIVVIFYLIMTVSISRINRYLEGRLSITR